MLAEHLDQLCAAQIARQFHAPARSSSRTRCNRTAAGLAWSKKYADTASRTLERNSSQVFPWVKISCERHSATYPPPASCVTLKTSSMPGLSLKIVSTTSSLNRAAACCCAHQDKSSYVICDFRFAIYGILDF